MLLVSSIYQLPHPNSILDQGLRHFFFPNFYAGPISLFLSLVVSALKSSKTWTWAGECTLTLCRRPDFFVPMPCFIERPLRKAVSSDTIFCSMGSQKQFTFLTFQGLQLLVADHSFPPLLTDDPCLSSSLSGNALLKAARSSQCLHQELPAS